MYKIISEIKIKVIPDIFWIVLVLLSRKCFKPNPVTVIVTITYQAPSIDDAIKTIINFVRLVDDTSINCEKMAANQMRILGFSILIAKPCANEFNLFCSSSIDIFSLEFFKNKIPKINKKTLPQNCIAVSYTHLTLPTIYSV